jgi:hypothetical protein
VTDLDCAAFRAATFLALLVTNICTYIYIDIRIDVHIHTHVYHTYRHTLQNRHGIQNRVACTVAEHYSPSRSGRSIRGQSGSARTRRSRLYRKDTGNPALQDEQQLQAIGFGDSSRIWAYTGVERRRPSSWQLQNIRFPGDNGSIAWNQSGIVFSYLWFLFAIIACYILVQQLAGAINNRIWA